MMFNLFLPQGLELVNPGNLRSYMRDAGADDGTLAAGSHPVLLTFCVQTRVGAPFTDFNYKEFILGVPYV